MSSYIYAQMAQQKQVAAQAATTDAQPGATRSGTTGSSASATTAPAKMPSTVAGYVEALTALIPAEVLSLHALILTATTRIYSKATPAITVISDYPTLRISFWCLAALSLCLYLLPRLYSAYRTSPAGTKLKDVMSVADWLRSLIPPLAFTAWTMLQRMTAFDAAFPQCTESQRTVIGLFLATVLIGAASWLAFKQPARPSGG